MNILIDIGHPAHVHLFKNLAHKMTEEGNKVHFTLRDKEFELALLEHEGFNYTNFGKHYRSKIGKMFGLFKFTFRMILTSLKFKPDLFLSHGSFYAAFASFFIRKPNIALEDTGNWEQVRLYLPFTETVLTSTSFQSDYGKKQIRYNGYHELAYLHPRYFKANRNILAELGVNENERYFLLRFVSWDASHDAGQTGLSIEVKKQLVELLSRYGKVLISSERKLDNYFEPYRFSLPPYKMHDALAFADLFIGEGATMASECAIMGTPAIYVNSIEAGTIDEQEKYGLVFHFRDSTNLLAKVMELIDNEDLKVNTIKACKKMLSEKIDVSAFLIWFLKNWPQSPSIVNEKYDETMEQFHNKII